jgi:hypothetical protein
VQDQKSLTRRRLSFPGWGREQFLLVFDYKGGQYIRKEQRSTNVNILRLAIGYLNATRNRITQIPEPEIGTDGSSQTQKTRGLAGTDPSLARQDAAGRVFGQVWNRLEPF